MRRPAAGGRLGARGHGGLYQHQFELEAGIRSLPDGTQGLSEQVDEGHGARHRRPRGLAAQSIQLFLGGGDARRHVLSMLHNVEVPQVAEEVFDELGVVYAALAEPLNEEQRSLGIVLVGQVYDLEQEIVLNHAQDVESLLERYLAA